MTFGELAGLIAAATFLLLVGILAIPLIKLGGVLTAAEDLVRGIAEKTVPLLGEVTTSVVQVNLELERVDSITQNVVSITTNAKALTGVFAATLGSPMVKVAAFSYGVRRAIGARQSAEATKIGKAAMKAGKKTQKSSRKGG